MGGWQAFLLVVGSAMTAACVGADAATWDPMAKNYGGRGGTTLYVSKLGDGSKGRSWATAFHTIQAALSALPDRLGGHRILIRPDTYMEANLFPNHPGAAGAYNALIGDTDGRLGSGTRGPVVIDSGDPGTGFKSYDWWGPIRAYSQGWSPEHKDSTFSAIGWDRWVLRGLTVTGGDGGLFWDCTNRVEPFTVVVEDCVSIGRAFGGGVASCLSRHDEPITFRRCRLVALDWWGDTAGAYVRIENPRMPDRPDVLFEDCTMISPQCALKGGNFGFHTFMRVRVNRCRLVVLNFSQPQGTPTDGIIQSVEEGRYLHVDLEDSLLMGYRVFGVRVHKETAAQLGYTVKGSVQAYVQFQQQVPEGMLRLGHWPVELLGDLLGGPQGAAPTQPEGVLVRRDMCEVSPFLWKGRPCLLECVRPASGGTPKDYCLVLRDVETGEELSRLAEGYSLASALAYRGKLYVFASRFEGGDWNDVTCLSSRDLKQWDRRVAITQAPPEHLFNSSVCRGPEGFVMAYETNDPAYPPFTIKFARSKDLKTWATIPGALFGKDRYAACPCLRFSGGRYYLLYLEHRTPCWFFETYIARSGDLVTWELSAANPVLSPKALDEGINASDPDLIELGGKTRLYYAVGDQRTWMNIKRRDYPTPLKHWLESWF